MLRSREWREHTAIDSESAITFLDTDSDQDRPENVSDCFISHGYPFQKLHENFSIAYLWEGLRLILLTDRQSNQQHEAGPSTQGGNEADCLINEPGGIPPPWDNDLGWHFLSCYGKVINAVTLWKRYWVSLCFIRRVFMQNSGPTERTVLLPSDTFSIILGLNWPTNAFAAGASPRTLLGELTALPIPPSWIKGTYF